MQEILDLINSYARAVWLKRWWVLAIAWIVCAVGWSFVMTMPDQYRAKARVHIDTQSFLRPMLRGIAFGTSAGQQVQLMVRTLLSRPNLEKIARMTDMDLSVKTDQDMSELLDSLKKDISLSKVDRQQNLYVVSFVHEDRELAKRVVQAVLTLFVESALGESRAESVTAARFLDAEIKEYEERLRQAEGRVVEFKRKNVGLISTSGNDYYQRLQGAMGQVESAKLLLTEALRQKDAIEEQIEDQGEELSFIFDNSGSEGSTSYDHRIAALESQLDGMFLKYTDKHPDVITLNSQLEDLRAKRAEELENRVELVDQENPVMQSLKLSLSNTEAKAAALTARVKSYEKKVAKLQKLVHTIPAVEAELKDLNRDYSVVKRKFNELLSRREQAKLTQKASQASDDIEFKVIDPTRVPFKASGPPRIVYMSLVLVGGMGVGLAFAILLVLIRPTFSSARALGLVTGLPVLGTVGLVTSDGQIALDRRYMLAFAGGGFLLLVAYSALLLVQLISSTQAIPL